MTGLPPSQPMSAHTPAPWRLRTTGNMGNLIEAYCGKRLDDHDDGYRTVATYQECCSSNKYLDQRANCDANGAFIIEAVNSYASLKTQAERAHEAWLAAERRIDELETHLEDAQIEVRNLGNMGVRGMSDEKDAEIASLRQRKMELEAALREIDAIAVSKKFGAARDMQKAARAALHQSSTSARTPQERGE